MSSPIEWTGFSSSCATVAFAATHQHANASSAIPIQRLKRFRGFKEASAICEQSFVARPFSPVRSSRSRMRRLVRVAAWRLPRGELHHFNARAIGIERIDAVLAVAPNLGAIELLPAPLFELRRRDICIFDAER